MNTNGGKRQWVYELRNAGLAVTVVTRLPGRGGQALRSTGRTRTTVCPLSTDLAFWAIIELGRFWGIE